MLPRLTAFLAREALTFGLFAVYCVVVLAALPQELVQDSWLTLVSGREVVEHGLPAEDRLAVWTSGATWVDQQWLAQAAFYELFRWGGIKLALLFHAGLLAAAFGLALAAARRRGASAKSVALVGAVAMFVAPWTLQLRAQSFAILLFVATLALLTADSRAPCRRVYLVLPLLVAWANLHGTVVLGAALVALRGLTAAAEGLRGGATPWRGRAAVLLLAPWPCLLASPYGTALVGYYRRMLLDPMLRSFIDEWGASRPSAKTAVFYVLAFAAVWVVARHGNRLTRFERLALGVTLVAGVTAIRSIVWFGLTALVVLPVALDEALASRPSRFGPGLRAAGAAVAVAVVLVGAGVAAARPASWYTSEWPHAGGRALATAAAGDPSALVLADDRHADWILWEHPATAGRLAYDVRFELLPADRLRRLFRFRNRIGDDWRAAGRDFRLVALDPRGQEEMVAALLAERGARVVYRDDRLAVIERPGAGMSAKLASRPGALSATSRPR